MDRPSDSFFEIDLVTRIHLNTVPSTRHTHKAVLSAYTDSVSDDYAPEVLLAHTNRIDEPLISNKVPI